MKKKTGKPQTVDKLAQSLRRNATRHELMLHGALQFALAKYDAKYVFQQPIGPYVADFWIGAARLVIEADGSSHGTPWGIAHDCDRARFIEAQGIRIMRFSNDTIEKSLVMVVDAILDECRDVPPASANRGNEASYIVSNLVPVKAKICPPGSALREKSVHVATNKPKLRAAFGRVPAIGWHIAKSP